MRQPPAADRGGGTTPSTRRPRPLAPGTAWRYGGPRANREAVMPVNGDHPPAHAPARPPADRIRNVVLVGHRGVGKTSLHEALLFEAGALQRLGSVPDRTTVSDADPDEQARQMSISASLQSLQWQGRRINLIDTPGDPSFVADALGALRVCESAVFVVNAVMGVEVATRRLWARAAELDIARMLFVNMLDRERADFFRTLDQLKGAFGAHVVATEIPMGTEQDVQGVIDLVDMKAFRSQSTAEQGAAEEVPIPDA